MQNQRRTVGAHVKVGRMQSAAKARRLGSATRAAVLATVLIGGAIPLASPSLARSVAVSVTKATKPTTSYDKLTVAKPGPNLSVVLHSPTGKLRSVIGATEVRWLFDRPVVDLSSVGSRPDPTPYVTVDPPVPGSFRWPSTRMLVFTPSAVLPGSTAYTVTLNGLKALDGTTLSAPDITRFETPRIRCSLYDSVLPSFRVVCDQRVTAESLVAHTQVSFRAVNVKVSRYQPAPADLAKMRAADPTATAAFEKSLASFDSRTGEVQSLTTSFIDQRACDPDSATSPVCYRLESSGPPPLDSVATIRFTAGITSLDGPLPGEARTDGRIALPRTPFVVTNRCRVDCDPENGYSVNVVGGPFTPLGLNGLLRVTDTADQTTTTFTIPSDVVTDDDVPSELQYPFGLGWAKLKPLHTYEVRLDPKATNTDGIALAYPSITTVSVGRFSGYAWFNGGERVLESSTTGLSVRVRNVSAYDRVQRRITMDELATMVRSYAGLPKAHKLNLSAEKATTVALTRAADSDGTVAVGVSAKVEPGVYLLAVRPRAYVAKSEYNSNGTPWSAADEARAVAARARKNFSTGPAGDGWSSALVQRTNLAVTLKRSPANVFVAVTDLSTGAPVKGAKVSLYGIGSKSYWVGSTNGDGVVIGDPDTQPDCGSCDVVAVVEKGADLAYAQSIWREWGDELPYIGSDASGDTSSSSSSTVAAPTKAPVLKPGEQLKAALFADRGVYKLGETVRVKGMIRTETPAHLELPQGVEQVQVTVTDARDASVAKRVVKVSNTGAFNTSFPVPIDGIQGTYRIDATVGENALSSAYFLVTTYRKPDFVVDVKTKKPSYISGDTMAFDVDGRYLYGAPMAGAPAAGTFTASNTSVNPVADHPELKLDGYRWDFVCYDTEVDACGPQLYGDEIGSANGNLDPVGHATATHEIAVQTVRHQPLSVDFESNVTDVSRQSFAARATAIVHPGDFYLGVRQIDTYTAAGQPMQVAVVSVSPDGKIVTGKAATATLIRWDWVNVKRDNSDGTFTTVGRYRKTVVATQPVTTGPAPAELTFTPDKAGEYEIRVESTDGRGNHIEAGETAYVLGKNYVAWRTSDTPTVNLIPDKTSYAAGDTAKILVQSPWPKAEALLTLERNGVLEAKRFSITSSASTIEVPITGDYAPNIYASVVVFKGRTAPPSKDNPDDPGRPQVLFNTAELLVPLKEKTLDVKVTSDRKDYLPGSDASAVVTVHDASGKPASGEATLWAVDDGVLRLTNYTTPDLVGMLYPERPLIVDTADSRMRVVALPSAEDDKGGDASSSPEPGGGGGEESTGDGIRTDFRILAAWSATVKLDKDGKATVPMKLPQSLTSYRIIAVASSGADRFGGGSSNMQVRKPFSLLPSLPRFVNLGDTFEAGAVVHNDTGKTGDAKVTLTLPADSPVTVDGPTTITVPGLTDKPTEVRFTLKATKIGSLKLSMKGVLAEADTPDTSDAVAGSLPVTITRRLEAVAASGTVKAGSKATEQLQVPGKVYPDLGGLDVTAASSALAGLQNGIASLVEYPYGCLEQRSSRIRVLLELTQLDGTFPLPGIASANLKNVIQTEIRKIGDYQTADGGLAYWSGDERPDLYLSPRVLLLLLDARAAGFRIPSGLVPRLTQFLQDQVGSLGDANANATGGDSADGGDGGDGGGDLFGLEPNRAFISWALARTGRAERALTDFLYEGRYELSFTEEVHLLRAMLENGRVGDEPNNLYKDLLASVRIEGDQASVQSEYDWSFWPGLSYLDSSRVGDTSELLSLLVKTDPTSELVPKMARWLLAQRENGTWSNTLDDGLALHALMDVARTTEAVVPDLQAQVLVGTTKVLDEKLSGRDLTTRMTSTAIPKLTSLTGGAATPLTVTATGQGTLQWSARLRYAPDLASLTPLDAGFTVERTYLPYTKAGVKRAAPATTFKAGDLVRVVVTFSTAQARSNVVVDDPLPAGLEALNAALENTSVADNAGSTDSSSGGTWYAGIDRTEIRDDRVLLFATTLEPGTHEYTYVARATAPGTFVVPPVQAEEMYRPEVFGRNGTVRITVTPPAG